MSNFLKFIFIMITLLSNHAYSKNNEPNLYDTINIEVESKILNKKLVVLNFSKNELKFLTGSLQTSLVDETTGKGGRYLKFKISDSLEYSIKVKNDTIVFNDKNIFINKKPINYPIAIINNGTLKYDENFDLWKSIVKFEDPYCTGPCPLPNINYFYNYDIERLSFKGSAVNATLPQYIIYDKKTLSDMGMDYNLLTTYFNTFIKNTVAYFNLHPNLKGQFVFVLVFFPSYGAPYQFTGSEWNKTNNDIKNHSVCNKEKFCQFIKGDLISYQGSDQQQFMEQEYGMEFIKDMPFYDSYKNYPTKKDKLKPMKMAIIFGTNGYKVDEASMQKIMGKLVNNQKP